jgi:hypothetical protein
MAVAPELEDRLAQWLKAYRYVQSEITPAQMRTILAEMDMVEGVSQLQSYMQLANGVMANDRTAADVAARLVYGVRPPERDV